MSYRDIRSSDNLFSKTNRNDRYKQMTKQQQLIEEKKRQIQEKLELQRKKIVDDSLLNAQPTDPKVDRKPLIFSNDGSFLDQFKKMSGMTDVNFKNGNVGEENSTGERQEESRRNSECFEEKDEEKAELECEKIKSEHEEPVRLPPSLPPDRQGQRSPLQTSILHPPHNPLFSQPSQPLPNVTQHPTQIQPQHSQRPQYLPFGVPPPPPPPPMMPPMMPQSIPPPLIPQNIPPPRPMNVQNIPPPPLLIPPPPLPPCFPPPPQFSVAQPGPPIPNLLIPPPNFNSTQVPAENVQGNSQSDRYSPQQEASDEKESPVRFQHSQGTNHINSVTLPSKEQPEHINDTTKVHPDLKDNKEPEQRMKKSGERKRKSRWSDEKDISMKPPIVDVMASAPKINVTGMSGHMLTKVTRTDPGLLQYALTAYGSTSLIEEDWKKAEENYKVHLLYQDMMAKRAALEKLREAGKNKYEYDSDEEIDEKGTWEHKLREKEMIATHEWAESLTEMAKGKHHIGDFLPPDELKKFLAKYNAAKGGGGEPDLSDYKEYKLGEDNKGFQMLQKLGWTEGQGLGSDGAGRLDPINKGQLREFNEGLGHSRPDDIATGDDEYDAYRKRMMLAYRFRPNPLNNPRRPYY